MGWATGWALQLHHQRDIAGLDNPVAVAPGKRLQLVGMIGDARMGRCLGAAVVQPGHFGNQLQGGFAKAAISVQADSQGYRLSYRSLLNTGTRWPPSKMNSSLW